METSDTRIAGQGTIHALDIWLATVDYSFFVAAPVSPAGAPDAICLEGTVRVINGERALTAESPFAGELILVLEDGRWCPFEPVSGNEGSGIYHLRLDGNVYPARPAD